MDETSDGLTNVTPLNPIKYNILITLGFMFVCHTFNDVILFCCPLLHRFNGTRVQNVTPGASQAAPSYSTNNGEWRRAFICILFANFMEILLNFSPHLDGNLTIWTSMHSYTLSFTLTTLEAISCNHINKERERNRPWHSNDTVYQASTACHHCAFGETGNSRGKGPKADTRGGETCAGQ